MYWKRSVAMSVFFMLLAPIAGLPMESQPPANSPAQAVEGEDGWGAPTAVVIKLGGEGGEEAPPSDGERQVLEVRENVSLMISKSSESLIFLFDGGEGPVTLSTIEAAWLPWVLGRFVVGWIEVNADENLSAAFFEYLRNEGGRKFNDTDTHIRLCVLKDLRPTGSCQTFEVGRTDIAYYLSLEPSRRWAYLGIDTTEPATMSDSRILTVDADRDGYRDLVLWRKRCRSMTPEEVQQRSAAHQEESAEEEQPDPPPECELHFQLQEETIHISYFRPEVLAFSKPEPTETLSIPERFDWRSLPSLEWVFIP